MAELAFVMPLLFMLLFGIMWFGRAFQIYSTVNQAARAAAEAAVVPSCSGCASSRQLHVYFLHRNQRVRSKPMSSTPFCRRRTLTRRKCRLSVSQTDQPLNASSPQEIGAIVSFTVSL